jgi:hypothetical protein
MEWQIKKALGVHVHENNVREHFYCVKEIFDLYNTKEKLEKLAARPDIDTVCAFDYYRMKTYALGTSDNNQGSFPGLRYEDFHPEAQGIKVPTL